MVETEMSFALVPTRVHFIGRRGCAGGVKEMPRDNRCMYMVHVCFVYVVVTGSVGMLAV